MTHPTYRVKSFEIVKAYTLQAQVDNDTEQTIDFQPMLKGKLYGALLDISLFNQVKDRSRGSHLGVTKRRRF